MQLIPTKNGSHPKHNPTYYSEKQREKSPKAAGNATAINAVRHHDRFGYVLEYRIPGGQVTRFSSYGKTYIEFLE